MSPERRSHEDVRSLSDIALTGAAAHLRTADYLGAWARLRLEVITDELRKRRVNKHSPAASAAGKPSRDASSADGKRPTTEVEAMPQREGSL